MKTPRDGAARYRWVALLFLHTRKRPLFQSRRTVTAGHDKTINGNWADFPGQQGRNQQKSSHFAGAINGRSVVSF